jgi:hypothetical protein
LSRLPSVLLTPVYVHVLAYDPQLRVAENSVIGRLLSDTPCATEKVEFNYVTLPTVNGLYYTHQEFIEVSDELIISTVEYACVSFKKVTELDP